MNNSPKRAKISRLTRLKGKIQECSTGGAQSKPKGRRTPYNYFIQDYQKQLKRKKCKIPFAKSAKLCAAKWKQLSQAAKRKYKRLANEDANRYKKEMQHYTPKEKKLKRRKKDPRAPLRPLSAYMWFSKTQWRSIAKANPGKTCTQITEEMSRLWKSLSPQKRKRYELMAEYDRKCYQQEKELYSRARGRKNKQKAKNQK